MFDQLAPTANLLRQWDHEHVWHPFAPMSSYRAEAPPIIERADGFDLIDVEGNRYLDGFSSLWCNVHGHRVPEIDQAIREQLDCVAHSTLLGHAQVRSIELAKALVDRAPKGLTKVFYSDSGATAVEAAIKIAFQYQRQRPGGSDRRNLFVTIGNAYHGDTIGAVSVGAIDLFHGVYGPLLFSTIQIPSPVTFRVAAGFTEESYLVHCRSELVRVLDEHRDRIAGVIMEPLVQGAAGILVHPPGFLRFVREETAARDVLLIADEVAVGFGRTGTLFACEREEVVPDLMCLGKGITGGYLPLAATIATDRIFEAFLGDPWENRTFFHGHTYTGNALACAAALASLELFEKQKLLDNVATLGSVIDAELAEAGSMRHVGEIRRSGVMVGIELVADRATKEPFPAPRRMGHAVTLAARRHGVMIRPLGDVVVLMPAPAMPADLVRKLCRVTIDSLKETLPR